jgi:hypothetical protein
MNRKYEYKDIDFKKYNTGGISIRFKLFDGKIQYSILVKKENNVWDIASYVWHENLYSNLEVCPFCNTKYTTCNKLHHEAPTFFSELKDLPQVRLYLITNS